MRLVPIFFRPVLGFSIALFCAFGSAPALATGIFSNTLYIEIPASSISGIANPYPSTINVAGMLGAVTKVTVTLHDFTHTCPDDVNAILVGPQGDQVQLMLQSGGCGGHAASGLTFTFDDAATTEIPSNGDLASGTFRPETLETLVGACNPMPAPFTAGTLGAALSVYNGKDPNGTWSLYVCDDTSGDVGRFAFGWTLNIAGATATMLESPTSASSESGIGLIRGWACEAGRIDVLIDGSTSVELPYGTSRPDTSGVCGDADNGFGGVVNWNRLGDGLHEIRAFADSVEFASATFTVTTLGQEYLTGAAGDFAETDFPDAGRNLTLRWSEPHQNFVFVGTGTTTGNPGDTLGDATARLESPFSGSSESGIGLIRGWACSANTITVMIDADPAIEASYGAARPDTQAACGDSDNGFGIVVNWNRYTSGAHRLRAFADSAATPFADVTFNVFNIGVEYLSGVGSPGRALGDFPAAGSTTEVNWSEAHQGVVITGYTP